VDLRPGAHQGMRRTYLTVFRNGRFMGVNGVEAVLP
jgi:hypothetical protein